MVSVYPTQKGGFRRDPLREGGAGYSGGGFRPPTFNRGPTQFRPPANQGGFKPPAAANEGTRNWWRDLSRALSLGTAVLTSPLIWVKPGEGVLNDPLVNDPVGYARHCENTNPGCAPIGGNQEDAYTTIDVINAGFCTTTGCLNVSQTFYPDIESIPVPGRYLLYWRRRQGGTNLHKPKISWDRGTDGQPTTLEWPVSAPQAVPGLEPWADPVVAPSADPFLLPVQKPMPAIAPVPFPLVRTAPATSPLGNPAFNGEPAYAPYAPAFGAPGTAISYGANVATALAHGMIPRVPPSPRERERKTNPIATWVYAGLGFITETVDAVDAVWEALDDEVKTRVKGRRTTPQQKLEDLFNNLDRLDVNQAFINLIIEGLEDRLWGALGKQTRDANRNDDRVPGWAAGPAI